jgi:hypothetical protein
LPSRYFGDQKKEIEKKYLFGIWFENLNEEYAFKDVSIDGRIILKYIHKIYMSLYTTIYYFI